MEECVRRGLPKEKLHPFGIPFSPKILAPYSQIEAKKLLNLDENKKVILLIGGSMGAGKLVALTKSFSKEERINDFQVIVICGNNEKIYNKLVKKYKDNHAFVIMGHTNQMPILMKASDIVYTKPGGLTSTETVASRKPMIITYPIPGCENANRDFFVSHNMALSANTPDELVKVGIDLLHDDRKIEAIKDSQRINMDENATVNIANFILNYLEK